MLVPSVFFVSVELDSSTGCSVGTTGEDKERFGRDLVTSPWPHFIDDLSASVFSDFIGPRGIEVTGFNPCGVINQG